MVRRFQEQMADYARGARLRELREAKHASQETVAFEVGVSTKTLRSWEHGGKIRWDNAKRLAAYYGEDPESLVTRETGAPEDNGYVPPSQLDRIEARIEQMYELLNALASGRKPRRLPAPTGALGRSLEDVRSTVEAPGRRPRRQVAEKK